MKTLRVLLITMFIGMVSLQADAMTNFNEMATDKVKGYVKQNNIKIIDYNYVKKAVAVGTRKGAKALVLDARPGKKYAMGHIPSSLSLPDTKYADMKMAVLKDVPKNRNIIAYCGGYHCVKSAKLAKYLKDDGYTNVKVYQAGMPEWNKRNYAEIDLSVAKAMFDKKSALFVDARPYSKFAGSTIVGSLSVPDTKFKQFAGFFPTQSKTPVITYCGGYACGKSHKVAKNLIMMGYTNVKVLAAGYPAWKKAQFPTTGAAVKKAAPKVAKNAPKTYLKAGEDTGTCRW